MSISRTDWSTRLAAFVVIVFGVVQFGAGLPAAAKGEANKPASKARQAAVVVETDPEKLPVPVAEMRDAILAAARSGSIDELLEPIQWNELKPDFGEVDAAKPIAGWKKLSVDGQGREILAILINLLEAPYAVMRQGRDIENNKMYVWPAFAELPLGKLPPQLETALLRLVPRDAFKAMKDGGAYTHWRLMIGADGTWHSFLRPKP